MAKARESGMPDEAYWETFFDADCLIERFFGGADCSGHVVEFGSGYGAFTLAAARRTTGTVFALDIEPSLIAHVQQRATAQGVTNIQTSVRDFVAEGIGLASATQTHAMVYNLLHLEEPVTLLAEAYRVLRPGGRLSVIHWRRDIPTPPVSSNASLENAGAAVYPESPKRVALVRLFQHSIVETSSRSRAIPRHHPQ